MWSSSTKPHAPPQIFLVFALLSRDKTHFRHAGFRGRVDALVIEWRSVAFCGAGDVTGDVSGALSDRT
jgi:hypothetical protein